MKLRNLFKALILVVCFFFFAKPAFAGSYVAGNAYVRYQGARIYLKGVRIAWSIQGSSSYRTVLTGDPISYTFPGGTSLDCRTQDFGYGSQAPACVVNSAGETIDNRGNINYVFPRIGGFGCSQQTGFLNPSFPEGYDGLPGNLSPEHGYWEATGFTVRRYEQPVWGVQIIWDPETQTLTVIDIGDADEYAEIEFEWVPENRKPVCENPDFNNLALLANPPEIATSSSSEITALAWDPDGDSLVFRRFRVEEGGGKIWGTGYNTAKYTSPDSIAPDTEREILLSYGVRDGQGHGHGHGDDEKKEWITCTGLLRVVVEEEDGEENNAPQCGIELDPLQTVTLSQTPVYTGESVFITGWAWDEDNDTVSFDNWQVDKGNLVTDSGKTVLFNAPATEETVSVSFEASDGVETVVCSGTFDVIPPGVGAGGWFQTSDGHVHANFSSAGDGIISEIPSTIDPDRQYFSLELLGSPGIASVGRAAIGTTTMFFGDGTVSTKGWQIDSYGRLYVGNPLGPFDFDYFYRELGLPTASDPKDFTVVNNDTLDDFPGEGFYLREGDLTIDGADWDVSGKAVFLVTGNLDIKNKIKTDTGNFLAFIVRGDINIDSSLGSMDLADEDSILDGVFITSQEFRTGSSNLRLVLSGIFVSYGGFDLGRDLGMGNDTTPPELFLYRSDFVISAPDELKKASITWEEVAP